MEDEESDSSLSPKNIGANLEPIIENHPDTETLTVSEHIPDEFTQEECQIVLETVVEEQVLPKDEDIESDTEVTLAEIPTQNTHDTQSIPPMPQPILEMPPPPRRGIQTEPEIAFETVEVPRTLTPMDKFHLLFSIWLDDARISRQQYASLAEILRTVTDTSSLQSLPRDITTLKRKLWGQVSLLPVRTRKITIIPSQLPTLSARQRHLNEQLMKNIYLIDPIPLVTKLLQSPVFESHMYKGVAELVSNPGELWQSLSWASSIRSTSGVFARYPNKTPIFPSDFIRYRCNSPDCCAQGLPPFTPHLGRVVGVYKQHENMLIRTQIIKRQTDLLPALHSSLTICGPPFQRFELIPVEDEEILLHEENVLGRQPDVLLDRQFENLPNASIRQTSSSTFTICRVYNRSRNHVRPLQQTHPIRGELEIAHYGRQFLIDTLSSRCISLPYQMFIDGFGLYRTMYRSIMGIYMIPSCVNAEERAKRSNVLPITLGPHGSNFSDVIASLPHLRRLEQGVDIPWTDGNNVITLAANEDTQIEGDQRQAQMSRSRTARAEAFRDLGLADNESPLLQICPALDRVTHFPSDVCHSEYGGISKMAHKLLVDEILTKSGKEMFLNRLRGFPFPPGWCRLQSPVTHLESYQLSEHARASIVFPLLLCRNLEKSWIDPAFYQGVSRAFPTSVSPPEDIIVLAFAAIARSNVLLSSRTMSQKDRESIKKTVERARSGLQGLLEAAALASQEIRRSRSRSQSIFLGAEGTPDRQTPAPSTNKKGTSFREMQRRPNMHIGIHYADDAELFGVPMNNNTLPGEGKHHDHKELVLTMNGTEVERTLLLEESFRRTLRFYLEGAYLNEDQVTTQTIQDAAMECPLVFRSLFHIDLPQAGHGHHDSKSSGINRLLPEGYSALKLLLPCSGSTIPGFTIPSYLSAVRVRHPFVDSLRGAYRDEYNKPYVSDPGKYVPRWYKKTSFYHKPTKKRHTLSIGDFLQYRQQQIGLVLGFFTHELIPGETRVFVYLQPLSPTSRLDPILLLPELHLQPTYIVVGLPGVSTRKDYVLKTTKRNTQQSTTRGIGDDDESDIKFTHCIWEVEFF
ncbi:hypothetical protein N7519_007190 [Penicillium mononematosum]|uniref:uncharacterized protein n=1 Tax=Penicillium mononematosum TaxID=268346 RepID=UPI0025478405|nr:uncharacterized protein N7519_007190 [Penicillium mononematosum]KAJ6185889.1 hypothetical protein N7519_007190 [Penicillium mononematosum]